MKDDEFNPYMKFHGVFIPNGIAKSEMPAQAKLLLGRLIQYSGRNGIAYPRRKTLCVDLGNVSLSVIDKNISTLKKLKLIRTYPLDINNKQSPNVYAFLRNKMYDKPLVKNDKGPAVKNDKGSPVKNDKHNSIRGNGVSSNKLSKDNLGDFDKSLNKETSSIDKKVCPKIIVPKKNKSKSIDSKNNTLDPKRNKPRKSKTVDSRNIVPPPKYSHTTSDLRNYNELIGHGITNHKSEKAKNNSLDKLHALFSKQCKMPYHQIEDSDQYINFEWDLDILIDVFEYQLKEAEKYNKKKIKSIGTFIFSEGYNGFKSWSPLIQWHKKMNKATAGELTEEGKKLFKSLSQRKIKGLVDLDSSIINKVSADILRVSEKYVFVDNGTSAMNYPMGITSVVSKYIKEKTNNRKYKLVYITKNGFIEKEFIPEAISRNILKKKHRGINVNA